MLKVEQRQLLCHSEMRRIGVLYLLIFNPLEIKTEDVIRIFRFVGVESTCSVVLASSYSQANLLHRHTPSFVLCRSLQQVERLSLCCPVGPRW